MKFNFQKYVQIWVQYGGTGHENGTSIKTDSASL